MKENLTRIVEALLFSSDGPLKVDHVLDVLPAAKPELVLASIAELTHQYDETQRAFMIVPLAGGFQLMTRPDVSAWVEKFLVGRRRKRLSRAALEVLAVVAYQQPLTRGEVESVRGVDCGGVFRTLLERELVDVRGRAKTAGNPLLYVTTDKFLEHFGIESLKDLPKLEEFKALVDRDEAKEELQRAGMIATDSSVETDAGDDIETEADAADETDAVDETEAAAVDADETGTVDETEAADTADDVDENKIVGTIDEVEV